MDLPKLIAVSSRKAISSTLVAQYFSISSSRLHDGLRCDFIIRRALERVKLSNDGMA
jgi:hypothetical protein